MHTRTHAVVFSLCFYVREYTSYSEKIRKFNQIYKIQPGTDNTSLSFENIKPSIKIKHFCPFMGPAAMTHGNECIRTLGSVRSSLGNRQLHFIQLFPDEMRDGMYQWFFIL